MKRPCFSKLNFMTRIIVYLLAILTLNCSLADAAKLSPERLAELHELIFRTVKPAAILPPAVYAICADDRGRLADPGHQWEATDVIADETLPRKRLIWAVRGGDYYVVHYERGGYAHSFHVLVAEVRKGDAKPIFIWHATAKERLKDFAAFLDGVAMNKLDDRPGTAN
jgi:hypothetical protein